MKLSVPERLVLMNLLPKEGDFATLKSVRVAKEMLAFDDDAEEFGVRVVRAENGDRITWDKDEEREIDLPARVLPVVVEVLTTLEKQKKLTEDHLSLYEKFIGE